jgi:Protein of unknown function (DUF3108)
MNVVSSGRICGILAFAWCSAGYGCAAVGQDATSTQARLDAAYTITFARITVGAATLNAEFKGSEYTIAATGHAGGVMRVLLNGSGSLATHGVVREGRLVPTSFTSKMESEAQVQTVRMVLDNGSVKELEVTPSTGGGISDADRQGIIDPLSAMLVPATGADGEEACRQSLPVFDGRHRYDLKLAFKRMDKLSDNHGYKGPVVVCALTYVPIAGQSGSPMVKYLSEGREIEVALAPLAGAPVLAPVRLFVASMVANLVVTSDRFAASVQPIPNRPAPADTAPQ